MPRNNIAALLASAHVPTEIQTVLAIPPNGFALTRWRCAGHSDRRRLSPSRRAHSRARRAHSRAHRAHSRARRAHSRALAKQWATVFDVANAKPHVHTSLRCKPRRARMHSLFPCTCMFYGARDTAQGRKHGLAADKVICRGNINGQDREVKISLRACLQSVG